MSDDGLDFGARLERHGADLLALVRREGGVVLQRFETPEDLVQGIREEALRSAPSLEWRGEEAFRSWLYTIARRHLGARRDYWFACKRRQGALLRLTLTGSHGCPRERAELAASLPGPSTFANRREQLTLITRAMAMLLARDREIVSWAAEGVAVEAIASRLGITRDAAERARSRALERLRKAFLLLTRPGAG